MRRPLVLVLILALAACDEPVDVVYVGGPPMEGGAPSPPPPPPPPPTTTPAPPPPGPSGPAVDVLSARSGIPRGIALDATNVYWSNHDSGSILKCAKAGCAKTPTVIAIAP